MAKKAATKSPSGSALPCRKLFFTASSLSSQALSEGALVVLPQVLRPINAKTVTEEVKLGSAFGALSADYLVAPLCAARDEGRLLMGWSTFREKETPLTWAVWDAFVLRWCGTDAHRSARREAAFSIQVFGEEALALDQMGLVTIMGNTPGQIGKKKDDPPKRSRAKAAAREVEGEEEAEREESDDDDEDMN